MLKKESDKVTTRKFRIDEHIFFSKGLESVFAYVRNMKIEKTAYLII